MNKQLLLKNQWLISLCMTAALLILPLQGLHAIETEAELTEEANDATADAANPADDNANETQNAWGNFAPPPDSESDWIQLSSGEWLKGQFRTLYDGQLEFKSSDLGGLSLDWDTVKQVRTAKSQTVRFEDPQNGGEPVVTSGLLTVDGDQITVGARTLGRADVKRNAIFGRARFP